MTATRTEEITARQFRESLRALVRRFSISERADTACCGMTVAQAETLQTLRAEGAMRLGDLGRRLGITPSTLTRNLTRLENTGAVERVPDPKDGRVSRVALTREGRAAAAQVEGREQDFARQILERMPPDRRRRAVAALADLLVAVREATEKCCPGAFDHLMRDFPDASRVESEVKE